MPTQGYKKCRRKQEQGNWELGPRETEEGGHCEQRGVQVTRLLAGGKLLNPLSHFWVSTSSGDDDDVQDVLHVTCRMSHVQGSALAGHVRAPVSTEGIRLLLNIFGFQTLAHIVRASWLKALRVANEYDNSDDNVDDDDNNEDDDNVCNDDNDKDD